MQKIEFIAEVKETKQAKSVSLDNVYSVKFTTDNKEILDLGKISPDQTVKVIVEYDN